MHVWSSWAVVCEPRRPGLVGPPGFHTTTREPKRAHLRAPAFENTTKIQREDTQRDTERAKRWREREEKARNFGRSGGGGSSGGVVRRKVVQGSPNHQQPQQRQAQNKWGREGPAPSRVFRGWAQQNNTTTTTTKIGQNTKTLKLAKVGLAKVGQHSKTLKLAKVGLAKVGQDHDWPKSVKKLAKVGLAKVGHDPAHEPESSFTALPRSTTRPFCVLELRVVQVA